MRTLGRLILLAVAGVLIWQGVTRFMNDYNFIKNYGGFMKIIEKIAEDENAKNALISFFKDIFWLLVAATALFGAIFAHGGFWMTIFTLVSLGLIGYEIYAKYKSGGFAKDVLWTTLKNILIDFGCQIGFVLGVVFLKIGNAKRE